MPRLLTLLFGLAVMIASVSATFADFDNADRAKLSDKADSVEHAVPRQATGKLCADSDRKDEHKSDKTTDKKDDKKDGRKSSSHYSKYRLSPDEVKKVIKLVEKDDPNLANKLGRVMSMMSRRPSYGDRSSSSGSRKPTTELSPAQVKAAIDIFRDRDAGLGKRIEDGYKENPDRVKRMLSAQWSRVERMIALKKSDPQLYKAQTREIQTSYQLYRVVGAMRKADSDAERSKLHQSLRDSVAANMKASGVVRELELARLEERVEKLKKQINDNSSEMDKLIDERVNELMRRRSGSSRSNSSKSSNSNGK